MRVLLLLRVAAALIASFAALDLVLLWRSGDAVWAGLFACHLGATATVSRVFRPGAAMRLETLRSDWIRSHGREAWLRAQRRMTEVGVVVGLLGTLGSVVGIDSPWLPIAIFVATLGLLLLTLGLRELRAGL